VELSPEGLRGFFDTVLPHLNEKQRRVVAGAMVVALGRGGQARVVEASKMSTSTVNTATQQVRAGVAPADRQRREGAGDKPAIDKQPGLLAALDELVHPSTRGTPMSLLRWTLKSTYQLADDLTARGFKVSAELVRRLLHQMGSRCRRRPSRAKVPPTRIVTASSATSTTSPLATLLMGSR
jgi:hypothetical protein